MSRASIKETEGQFNTNLPSICDTPIKEEYILEKENVGDSRFSSYLEKKSVANIEYITVGNFAGYL